MDSEGHDEGGCYLLHLLLLMCAIVGQLNVCTFAGILAASIAWFTISRPLALWLLRRSARNLYAPGKNKSLLGRHTLEISERSLYQRSEAGADEIHFDALERIAETSTHVFVYVSAASAYAIPKNKVFDGDLAAFVAGLKSRIAAAAIADRPLS